jgi:hypothetical protein
MALSGTTPDLKQVLYSLVCIFGLWTFFRLVHATRRDIKSTPLRGPPRKNLLFGVSGDIQGSSDSSVLYEQWAKEYGFAYSVPYSFGSSQIVLVDPKAVAESVGYSRASAANRRSSETKKRAVSIRYYRPYLGSTLKHITLSGRSYS